MRIMKVYFSINLIGQRTAANNALPKVRAGHWNIGCKSMSASVRAGRFQFSFCSYFVLLFFNLALVPGGTSNKFPNLRQCKTLGVMLPATVRQESYKQN